MKRMLIALTLTCLGAHLAFGQIHQVRKKPVMTQQLMPVKKLATVKKEKTINKQKSSEKRQQKNRLPTAHIGMYHLYQQKRKTSVVTPKKRKQ